MNKKIIYGMLISLMLIIGIGYAQFSGEYEAYLNGVSYELEDGISSSVLQEIDDETLELVGMTREELETQYGQADYQSISDFRVSAQMDDANYGCNSKTMYPYGMERYKHYYGLGPELYTWQYKTILCLEKDPTQVLDGDINVPHLDWSIVFIFNPQTTVPQFYEDFQRTFIEINGFCENGINQYGDECVVVCENGHNQYGDVCSCNDGLDTQSGEVCTTSILIGG